MNENFKSWTINVMYPGFEKLSEKFFTILIELFFRVIDSYTEERLDLFESIVNYCLQNTASLNTTNILNIDNFFRGFGRTSSKN